MTDIVCRPAAPTDHPALQRLLHKAAWANTDDRAFLSTNLGALVLDAALLPEILVAERAGQPVGFVHLQPAQRSGTAELDGLFVDPAHWRHGIGRALVDAALSLARGQGIRLVALTANPAARGFWTACGFRRVGSTGTASGQAARFEIAVRG